MYKIIMTMEQYSKGNKKTWGKPIATEEREITRTEYNNYVEATPFFNKWGFARNYYNYTCQGYIPVKCITIDSWGKEKKVATFKFIGI